MLTIRDQGSDIMEMKTACPADLPDAESGIDANKFDDAALAEISAAIKGNQSGGPIWYREDIVLPLITELQERRAAEYVAKVQRSASCVAGSASSPDAESEIDRQLDELVTRAVTEVMVRDLKKQGPIRRAIRDVFGTSRLRGV